VDADGKTLGRLATRIATVLMGKHRADFTPHADNGDFVIVVNAAKIHLTGKKWSGKIYIHHSGHPGGLRHQTAAEMRESRPTRLVEHAVRGMLPLNKLRAPRMKRLRIFAGAEHEHAAQNPQPLKTAS
jgi:large subunit ribosomal protein L13